MIEQQFDVIATELFGSVLAPLGFTNQGSMRCTFYRKVDNVFHFIVPVMGLSGTWYYVRVFPDSPSIDPLFRNGFPDKGGIPTDSFSCLSEREVGLTQQHFNCKNEENFRRGFAKRVLAALRQVAVPYLDQFQTAADIVPAIRNSSLLGFGLLHVGRVSEARAAFEKERERLQRSDTTNPDVKVLLDHVEHALSECTRVP